MDTLIEVLKEAVDYLEISCSNCSRDYEEETMASARWAAVECAMNILKEKPEDDLSDNEKDILVSFIEEAKELDTKYNYGLFDD